jgi:hypothetical protein
LGPKNSGTYFFKIFLGFNGPTASRFRGYIVRNFGRGKKFFVQFASKPDPQGQRLFAAVDSDQTGINIV